MVNYRKTYNKKIRDFCDKFYIDRELAASAINVKPDAFSRLTGEKSMHVSRPLRKEEYINFIQYIKSSLEDRLATIIALLDDEIK